MNNDLFQKSVVFEKWILLTYSIEKWQHIKFRTNDDPIQFLFVIQFECTIKMLFASSLASKIIKTMKIHCDILTFF